MNGHRRVPSVAPSDVLLCRSDGWKQQCSQRQAGRAMVSFFDLGTGVLPKSVLLETALAVWWAALADTRPLPAGEDNRERFSDYRLTISY